MLQENGVRVPYLILGDGGFTLCYDWLQKPYTAAKQRYFNYRLNRVRMVSEVVFGVPHLFRINCRFEKIYICTGDAMISGNAIALMPEGLYNM